MHAGGFCWDGNNCLLEKLVLLSGLQDVWSLGLLTCIALLLLLLL
jgi:hypothetical protein